MPVNLRDLQGPRPEDAAHKNPPLHKQNVAYRGADTMRHSEEDQIVERVSVATRAALGNGLVRRFQKTLRPKDNAKDIGKF